MLFYERRATREKNEQNNNKNLFANTPGCSTQTTIENQTDDDIPDENDISMKETNQQKLSNDKLKKRSLLSKDLEDWIWQDNRHYLEDRNIFEHTYFK